MALKRSIRLHRRTAFIRCKLGCGKRRFRSKRGFCLPASEGRSRWLSTLNPSSSTARLASSKWNSIGSKKSLDQPANERRTWVNIALDLTQPAELMATTATAAAAPTGQPQAARVVTHAQCALAGVSRATVYAHTRPVETGATDLVLCQLIDEQYTARPFYGTRRMVLFLRGHGHTVNRKRVQRLMRGMGLAGIAPGPNTSRARTHPAHKIYPYLLRGVVITRPNQVWSTDITYVRLNHGFAYLVGHHRLVLAPCARVVHQQPHGGELLRGVFAGRHDRLRQARSV